MKQDNDDIFEFWIDHLLDACMAGLLVATSFVWLPFYVLGRIALKVKAMAQSI